MPRIARRLWATEAPSRIAISAGTVRMFRAIVAAVATIRSATKPTPPRAGSTASNAYATTIVGVEDPAMLMSSARGR
jgi:hypothetical protein